MKNLLLVLFMAAGVFTGRLLAQGHEVGGKEKMRVFADWAGHWKGEGTMQSPTGEARKSTVDERIEWKLDGTVLLVEGIGKAIDPTSKKEVVVHHALAVLSHDQRLGEYKFRSYLNDGRSTDAWLKVLAQNKYQWGYDSPHGKMRYNITIDPAKKIWNETGEFSRDGTVWMKVFEMDLAKVD